MADILFKCSSCSATLFASSDHLGQVIYCGQCQERNTVDKMALDFECPHCSTPLLVSDDFVGQAINCPKCHNEIDLEDDDGSVSDDGSTIIETQTFFICPSCSSELSAPESSIGEIFDCASCGKPVQVPISQKKPRSKAKAKAKLRFKPKTTQIRQQPVIQMARLAQKDSFSSENNCLKCGKANPPGCVLCTNCGIRLLGGEFPARAVSNGMVWIVAFAPIFGTLLQYVFAGMAGSDPADLWFITLVINIACCIADDAILKKNGHDTEHLGGWCFLVPVYLFKRATLLQHSLSYFIVWIICFFVSFFL